MCVIRVVSFLVGFVSLSLEIVWLRVIGFYEGNTAQVLSLVLGVYLIGIAVGALVGRHITNGRETPAIRRYAGRVLIASGCIDVSAPLILIALNSSFWTNSVLIVLVFLCSTSKAAVFPVVHHLGTIPGAGDTGRSLSKIYFFNILGSTAGPLLVGFLAYDVLTSQQIMALLGILTVVAGVVLFVDTGSVCVASLVAVLGLFLLFKHDPHGMMKALTYSTGEDVILYFNENKYGVVHTFRDEEGGDVVYGGNVYDGRINIDPVSNANRIDRLLLLSGMHNSPRRVLVIGLSGGAWLRVISDFPEVESIDVVELNSAYLGLIGQYPDIRAALKDPRVRLYFDDGRRWLSRSSESGYDLVIMNTTFHWRSYASGLLSFEFFSIVKSHLLEGGILAFNATGSPDALFTASKVFNFSFRRDDANFVYASDRDYSSLPVNWGAVEAVALRLTGGDRKQDVKRRVNSIAAHHWISANEEAIIAKRPLELITDQNMLTEYKRGRSH